MKLYEYWLGLYPLDWEFCFMPVQTYKNFITEQYHKNPTFYNISVGSIEKVLAHIDVILSAAMDAVGEMLDEAEKLAKKAKAAIKAALADEDSRYHSVVTFFMEFHRDDVGPDIAAELFPGTDPAKLSFAEMVDFLRLKRFGSLVDSETDQQVFILDLSFNPEITDELMVIYFDLNKEIFCITHES